jgi:hypothetical protein
MDARAACRVRRPTPVATLRGQAHPATRTTVSAVFVPPARCCAAAPVPGCATCRARARCRADLAAPAAILFGGPPDEQGPWHPVSRGDAVTPAARRPHARPATTPHHGHPRGYKPTFQPRTRSRGDHSGAHYKLTLEALFQAGATSQAPTTHEDCTLQSAEGHVGHINWAEELPEGPAWQSQEDGKFAQHAEPSQPQKATLSSSPLSSAWMKAMGVLLAAKQDAQAMLRSSSPPLPPPHGCDRTLVWTPPPRPRLFSRLRSLPREPRRVVPWRQGALLLHTRGDTPDTEQEGRCAGFQAQQRDRRPRSPVLPPQGASAHAFFQSSRKRDAAGRGGVPCALASDRRPAVCAH